MRVVHISDTHTMHRYFKVPSCDLLIHSGDIGNFTNINDLTDFLVWFEQQDAECKIFIAGNHDLVLDKNEAKKAKGDGNIYGYLRMTEQYQQALELIQNYKVKYLNNTEYVYRGVKIWGSPYSPAFGKWAFNAKRGAEIQKIWARIPNDVDILVTHTPVYGILDDVKEYARQEEDAHVGCKDLLDVIKKRLKNLKLHCSGHIHDNFGVQLIPVTNTRRVYFSNGAMITNKGDIIAESPFLMNLYE